MDGGTSGPIGTRDAVIEVAYSVGALVRAVRTLATGLEKVSEAVEVGGGDRDAALTSAEAALATAGSTADTSIANVVKLLEAMGETPP